jgi:hypothetical protein
MYLQVPWRCMVLHGVVALDVVGGSAAAALL